MPLFNTLCATPYTLYRSASIVSLCTRPAVPQAPNRTIPYSPHRLVPPSVPHRTAYSTPSAENNDAAVRSSSVIGGLDFDPHQAHIGAVHHDGRLRVFDVRNNNESLSMPIGHCGPVMSLAYSPHTPGLLFSGASDGMMKAIWTERKLS